MNDSKPGLLLVYDKQCPFCDAYCKLVRVQSAAGSLELVDARQGGPQIQHITEMGLDVDEGMVLIAGNELYYGADAIHALALLSSRSGVFNRLNFLIFRSKTLSRLLYPLLRTGRNLALKLLGRSRINNLNRPGNDRF
ncbi:MAG: DUF393 domain-containing protein [Gammaproteobacteria bacterium]|nr:DUF393 domain-containing protein [Gammaproteobacteria bacterium]